MMGISSRTFIMNLEFSILAPAKRKTSFAKSVFEINGPWDVIGIGVLEVWLCISKDRNSIPRIKR